MIGIWEEVGLLCHGGEPIAEDGETERLELRAFLFCLLFPSSEAESCLRSGLKHSSSSSLLFPARSFSWEASVEHC